MRAVLLTDFKDLSGSSALRIEDIPKPTPQRGEILVHMAFSSINPSDLVFLRNQYGVQKPLPTVPGFEGSGTVVESRAGLYGRWLVGRRVAVRASDSGNGTWAEFMVIKPSDCIPLKSKVTLEQGASLIVNPLTAWSLVDQARCRGHRGFIQTAAASAVGRMIGRLARRLDIPAIHIVRRAEQVDLLKAEGATLVLDSTQPDFVQTLRQYAVQIHATTAFDAVGGPLTATLAEAMPRGSEIRVYGALAGTACSINPQDLIFKGKSVHGFWLGPWIKQLSWWRRLQMVSRVQDLLATDLATHVQAHFPLEKIQDALSLYKDKRTLGKVLLHSPGLV